MRSYSSDIFNLYLLALTLYALFIFGFNIGSSSKFNSHESLVAETVQEMQQKHEFLIPYFNGKVRLQKPPLQYWLVMASSSIFGKLDEFSARIPSLLASLSSVVFIAIIGKILFNQNIGILSSLIFSTSSFMIPASRSAKVDMVLTFLILFAHFLAIKRIFTNNHYKYTFLLLWVITGFAILAKGPIGFIFIILPVLAYLIFQKDIKTIKDLFHPFGIIMFFLISLPWFLYIWMKIPGALNQWYVETIGRFSNFASGRSSLYYIKELITLYLPWSLFIPIAIYYPLKKEFKEYKSRFLYLGLWFLVGFTFLTISAGKRAHYLYPILPPLSFFIAISLFSFEKLVFYLIRLRKYIFLIISIFFIIIFFLFIIYYYFSNYLCITYWVSHA